MDTTFDIQAIQTGLSERRYPKIGTGSGRRVYEFDSEYVIKAAYNRKGYAQNQAEAHISQNDDSELFAKILFCSPDYYFLIMERAEHIRNFSVIYEYFHVRTPRELFSLPEFKGIIKKYNLLIPDLRRPTSWGLIGSRPVIIDYGFTALVKRKYYSIF